MSTRKKALLQIGIGFLGWIALAMLSLGALALLLHRYDTGSAEGIEIVAFILFPALPWLATFTAVSILLVVRWPVALGIFLAAVANLIAWLLSVGADPLTVWALGWIPIFAQGLLP